MGIVLEHVLAKTFQKGRKMRIVHFPNETKFERFRSGNLETFRRDMTFQIGPLRS